MGQLAFWGFPRPTLMASPATMLVSVDRKTSALAGIRSRGHFAINVLPATAAGVAEAFGGWAGISGAARFAPGEWRVLSTGAPVFCDALGAFDCAVEEILERGDIFIVIGKVVAVASRADGDPLIFFRGRSHADLGAGG
jgi:flavin reductase (DIM6/NTAB) family NADH-FMN oxidoreductase RutF